MNHSEAEQILKPNDRPLPASLSAPSTCQDGLHELILKAKVISFDVFDTLLVRTVLNAADVFVIMEHESGIAGFHKARIRAEAKAREKLNQESGSPEGSVSV